MLGWSKQHKQLVVGAVLVVGLAFAWLAITPAAYADPDPAAPPANPAAPAAPGGNPNKDDDDNTCAIEKMGWVICPALSIAGKLGDAAFAQLAKHFLETEPELIGSSKQSGTYLAWELARNIANVMFIIAFLIIIFSQAIGWGISSYGIKKLLPRLIIAAIAVNISYYICQTIVDLTNILGYEIQGFLVDTAHTVSDKAAMPVAVTNGSITQTDGGGTLGVIAIAALGLTAGVFILLPILTGGITAIVIACLVIVIILLLRKAFIVLLVVMSPIAFVMYLLPNTERLFHKWLSMFWQLLLVFPIVGLLFGGGQLASAIVLRAGQGNPSYNYSDNDQKCVQLPTSDPNAQKTDPNLRAQVLPCATGNAKSTPLMLGVVAAGIAIAPLFAVWAVLKGALSAAGALGGKVSGAVQGMGNKAGGVGKKPEDWMRKRAGENIQARWQNMKSNSIDSEGNPRNFVGRRVRGKAARDWKLAAAGSDLKRSEAAAVNQLLGDEDTARGLVSGLSEQGRRAAAAGALATQLDASQKEVAAERQGISNLQVGTGNIRTDAALQAQAEIDAGNFDSPHLAALLEHIAKLDRQMFMALSSQTTGQGRETVVSRSVASTMSSMDGLYGGANAAAVKRGEALDLRATALNNLSTTGISAENVAGLNSDGINTITSLVAEGVARGDTRAQTNVRGAVNSLSADQSGKLAEGHKATLQNI